MEWVYIILNIILFLFTILVIKKFLPSYFEEKAKNLATKQDIEIITLPFSEIPNFIKNNNLDLTTKMQYKNFYIEKLLEKYETKEKMI